MTTDLQRGIVTQKQTDELLDIVGELADAPDWLRAKYLQHRAAKFYDMQCPNFQCKHCAEDWAQQADDQAAEYAHIISECRRAG
jgi:hypothetical protein